jgi:hypothetical protein
MSVDQKIADFRQLAAVYAKNYGPYEWKRDVFGFDLFDLRPWLDRVRGTRTDLEFWNVCVEYVASLRDGHSSFLTPSTFLAYLPFGVDLYDGKVLVDEIDRSQLPRSLYPISVGDELVSVDGAAPEELIRDFARYMSTGNPLATRRLAAELIVFRPQIFMPLASKTRATALVAIRNWETGETGSFEIEWITEGVPLDVAGPVPSLQVAKMPLPARAVAAEVDPAAEGTMPVETGEGQQGPIRQLSHMGLHDRLRSMLRRAVSGFGARTPAYALPRNFVQRLGRSSGDVFYSGTYTTADGLRIGFIRIPNYEPSQGISVALAQWAREIAYFEQNTDGLVIDDTRNPGGDACYLQELIRLLTPETFRMLGLEFRATESLVQAYAAQVEYEKSTGSEQWVINSWQSHLDAMRQANREVRGRTGPLPICGPGLEVHPQPDSTGKPFGYSKPVIVLMDELSASAGDAFPAVLQDNNRAKIVGTRSMGLGGAVQEFKATHFSEGIATVTTSLMIRKAPVATGEFPIMPYVENIGVRPDVTLDFMTRDNLMSGGRPFVDGFTNVIADEIRAARR